MIGLKRDFIHNGKAMMTIDRTGGFVRSDLSEVQLRMLMSNVISGHLSVSMKEINQEITFNYDITGKKMLSQTVKHEKLSLTSLFQLLLQITETLLTCPQYMLDEQRYVLHEDYIFTMDTLEEPKVYLCYIPASLEKEAESIPFQLSLMISKMMPYVKALEGTGIQRILQLCNDDNFQLSSLQELLNELLMKETGVGSKSAVRTNSAQNFSYSAPKDNKYPGESQNSINEPSHVFSDLQRHQNTASAPKQIPVLPSRSNESLSSSVPLSPSTPLSRSSFEPMGGNRSGLTLDSLSEPMFSRKAPFASNEHYFDEAGENEDKKPAKPLYYWLGGMLLASALWRFLYMDEPATIKLVICVVLTIILAAAVYLLSTGKLTGKGKFSINSITNNSITKKEDHDDYDNKFSKDKKSSSFSLFQQKEEPDFPEKRGIFGGGNKNKENAEPWRWNTPSILDESVNGIGNTSKQAMSQAASQAAADSNFLFTVPKSLDNENHETSASYYDSLRHSTQMLNSSQVQATVLLTDSGTGSSLSGHSAMINLKKGMLERQSPHTAPEQIELGPASFIIGRSKEVSQFVEEGKGTSRAHVEISKNKDHYYIKDLNSMNGTLLLDQPMIPYKEYPLEEGDFFIIAESKYTFRYV